MPPRKKQSADADGPDEAKKNPAEAAAEEAAGENIDVEFRGEHFEIERGKFSSARLNMLISMGRMSDVLVELIGFERRDQDRFLTTLRLGETLTDIVGEFFGAVNAAAGVGNSKSSG